MGFLLSYMKQVWRFVNDCKIKRKDNSTKKVLPLQEKGNAKENMTSKTNLFCNLVW